MAIRYNFEETKEIVETTSECKLLDCWYENGHKQLKLLCSCGNTFQTNWRLFTRKDSTPIKKCEICRNQNKYKIKYLNNIIGDFLILDNWNENGNTIYKAKCVHCGEIKEGGRTIIDHAICDCQKNIRLCNRNIRLGNIYHGMIERCENPNTDGYKNYGGRGIKVCNEWKTYPPFEKWALENGYADCLSIDRIDVNGNYEPSNCRWVDNKTQALNKRNNHYITFNNKTQTAQEWGEEIGIKPNTIIYRLKRGWSVERALTTPVKK